MVTNLNVNLLNKDVNSLSGQALVVFAKPGQKETAAKLSHVELNKTLAASLDDKSITGKASECISFRELHFNNFRHVIVVGLGATITNESTRQAAAAAYKEIKSLGLKDVVVQFDGVKFVQAFVEGLQLASYSFDELKTKKESAKKETPIQIHLATKSADKNIKAAFSAAVITAGCTNFARRLGDMPGNLMTPTILADHAVEGAKGTGIKVTVWDKARIKKERMGGLLGVANGSAEEPRFIIMEYKGAAASKKPVVLVGKGLTFDTGGISIKPSAAMEEMKYDMCGGANVIGAILAIAQLKLKVNVTALIPSTENMPGSRATKPGDVHVARNGKTFEVNNTDAEGRLILSDALSYATELAPQLIVDAATLTGAMVMALGNIHTGYFTRNQALKNKVEKAAGASGELLWNMPLTDHHVKDMKGTFADLSNISSGKGAGSATAAAYLEQFVGEGIPWAHFDIAGTAWSVGNRLNYCSSKGASGAIVRTFVELAKLYQG